MPSKTKTRVNHQNSTSKSKKNNKSKSIHSNDVNILSNDINNNTSYNNNIELIEQEILIQFERANFPDDALMLSNKLLMYSNHKDSCALFLFNLVSLWTSPSDDAILINNNILNNSLSTNNNDDINGEHTNNDNENIFSDDINDNFDNNILYYSETNEIIRKNFCETLYNVTTKKTFDGLNKNAWALIIVGVLSNGLPTLCSYLIDWLSYCITNHNPKLKCLDRNDLRYLIMFLRPECVETCAELVSYNATLFEEPFKRLIKSLSDGYQPFNTWLFARLCSKKRDLLDNSLQYYILGLPLYRDNINSNNSNKKDKSYNNIFGNNNDNNVDRLLDAFRYCIKCSNDLIIKSYSPNSFELGHLLLTEIILIVKTMKMHYYSNKIISKRFEELISIMFCNESTIYLSQNKYIESLYCANEAIKLNKNSIQAHRLRSQIYIKNGDYNTALNDINEILFKDEDHPYGINTKKEISDIIPSNINYICNEVKILNINNSNRKKKRKNSGTMCKGITCM